MSTPSSTSDVPRSPPVLRQDACVNCGATLTGPFCAACGQQVLPARLTVSTLLRRMLAGVVDLDRGFLHTVVSLFRDPAAVVRDYLRGRTAPFVNPAKYFALILALMQVVALWSGAVGGFADGFTEHQAGRANAVVEFLDRYFVLLIAPAVPIFAAVQRMLFRKAARAYAEHLVFALFLSAQLLLISTPLVALVGLEKNVLVVTLAVLGSCVIIGYHLRAVQRFFGYPLWSSLWRALLTMILTCLFWMVVLAISLGPLAAAGIEGR